MQYEIGGVRAYFHGRSDNESLGCGPGWHFVDEDRELFFVPLPSTTPRATLEAVYDLWSDAWDSGYTAAQMRRECA